MAQPARPSYGREVVPGFPSRFIAVDKRAAAELKKRTLTNLYNNRPAWLVSAHKALDEAVAAAYGCSKDLDEGDMLQFLLSENLRRKPAQETLFGPEDEDDEEGTDS
jgi:hypothetical protein